MFQQHMPGFLKIDAIFLGKLFPNRFERPDRLSAPMVFIYNVNGVWKICMRDPCIWPVHVADEIFGVTAVIFLEIIAQSMVIMRF